jgi:hypothetical protein
MTTENKATPSYPVRLELAHYAFPGAPGGLVSESTSLPKAADTVPITKEFLEMQTGERLTLARVSIIDSQGRKASVFVTLLHVGGKLRVQMNQDQTDFGKPDAEFKTMRRDMPIRFFK